MKRGTTDHPKIDELCGILDIRRYEAVGILNTLWDWAGRFIPRGDIGKYSDRVIAKHIDWGGDPAVLIQGLRESKWIDDDREYRLVIHDWPEHCEDSTHAQLARSGQLFADGSRPKLSKIPEKERAAIIEQLNAQESAENRAAAQEGEEKPPTKPLPSLTKPDHDPVETLAPRSDERTAAATPLGSLPCIGGKKSWPFMQADVDGWRESYPAVDVIQKLREMREWLISNPRNRKTPDGMRRFVTNWLAKEQNRARPPENGHLQRPSGPRSSLRPVAEIGERIEAAYGVACGYSPPAMVDRARADGFFANESVTPEEVQKHLEQVDEMRARTVKR